MVHILACFGDCCCLQRDTLTPLDWVHKKSLNVHLWWCLPWGRGRSINSRKQIQNRDLDTSDRACRAFLGLYLLLAQISPRVCGC